MDERLACIGINAIMIIEGKHHGARFRRHIFFSSRFRRQGLRFDGVDQR